MISGDGQSDVPPYEVLVAVIKDRAPGVWGVRRFHRAVGIALGPSAASNVLVAWLVLAAPGAWLCTQGARHFVFAVLAAAAAVLGGKPGLNMIGCVGWSIVTALAYGGLALLGGSAGAGGLAWATAYPVTAWFVAGAIRGTTMHAIEEAMVRDQRVYERLIGARLLFAYVSSGSSVTGASPTEP